MDTFYGILLAIAIGVVIMMFQKKKIKESWSGVVVKLKREADYYDDDDNFREGDNIIHYKTDTGKKGKIRLRDYDMQRMYPNLKVGDRLLKESGQDYPKVV